MPSGLIHKIINFFVYLICLYYIHFGSTQWLILFTVIFSVFTIVINPDWDINTPLKHFFRHRGVWHNPVAWLIAFVPLYLFVSTAFVAGYIAVLSHIVADWIVTDLTQNEDRKDVRIVKNYFMYSL